MQKLETYLCHVAEDLKWVIQSPYLTKIRPKPDLTSHRATEELLDKLQADPRIILADLARMKRHNLGSYFETLVIFWLKHIPNLTIIAQNLQIQNDKQTLGELDLVFEYEDHFYHWELSVKFYANTFAKTDEACWVGPLKKDTLARKFNRLFDHQLPLIESARDLLDIPKKAAIASYPFVKGVLFHPANLPAASQPLPARVNPNCLQKTWLDVQNLENHFINFPSHFAVLAKLHWFSGTVYDEWHDFQSTQQITRLLEDADRPQLIAFATFQNGKCEPGSMDRFFVMPSDWLDTPTIGVNQQR